MARRKKPDGPDVRLSKEAKQELATCLLRHYDWATAAVAKYKAMAKTDPTTSSSHGLAYWRNVQSALKWVMAHAGVCDMEMATSDNSEGL